MANPFDQFDGHPPSGITNPPEATPEQSPGLLATVGRGLGLGVRDVLEGTVGPLYDLVGAGINKASKAGVAEAPPATPKQTGMESYPEEAFQADYAQHPIGLPHIAPFSENLTKLGLPEPKTDTEKFISGVTRPVAGVLPVLGAGAAMTRAASPV